MSRPKIIAIKKFAKTPAVATQIVPHFLLLKFSGLYGTGFAQPNRNEECDRTKSVGKIIEPKRSRCFSGFKVRRPAWRGGFLAKNYAENMRDNKKGFIRRRRIF